MTRVPGLPSHRRTPRGHRAARLVEENELADRTEASGRKKGGGSLKLIAGFKFFDALMLVLAGLGALGLLDPGWSDTFRSWLDQLSLEQGRHLVSKAAAHAIPMVTNTKPHRLVVIGIGCFVYAAVFVVEGVGLWRQKRWAEYLTAAITASLLPFELVAIAKEHSAPSVITLAINLLVLGYLVWRLLPRNRDDAEPSAAHALARDA